MYLFNFHTHTCFCDGSSKPELYVKEAVKKNFTAIGFSGHSPLPIENGFAIQDRYLGKYCKTIRYLEKAFSGEIKILLGLELDYIPGITKEFRFFKKICDLDYTIGAVHLIPDKSREKIWFIDGPERATYDQGLFELFKGDIKKAVTTYYEQINEMLLTQKPDVIAHLDKIKMHNQDRYFTEDEDWYRKLIDNTLKAVQAEGTIIEVNTRGLYKKRSNLFPDKDILERAYMLGIPVTISADAHDPSELDLGFDTALQTLKDIGYKKLSMLTDDGWDMIDIREFGDFMASNSQ